MMKQSTSFLTRCLAVVLALVLVLSNANLGFAVQVFAAEGEETVTDGALVAKNYEQLTDEEKALLNSGMLAGDSHTYTIPGNDDNLITIGAEKTSVTVGTYGEWTPTIARIIVDNAVVQTVDVVNNTASFNNVGDAFAVEVDYVLNYSVNTDQQYVLVHTAEYLKNGMANLETIKNCDSSLATVEEAMSALEAVVDQPITPAGEGFVGAVNALRTQIAANGGMLDLRVLNATYQAGTKYLMANASAYKAAVVDTYTQLATIMGDDLVTGGEDGNTALLNAYLEAKGLLNTWNGFKNILGNLVETLKPVAESGWQVTEYTLLSEGVDYTKLDNLVNAIDGTTEIAEYKGELVAENATVRKNESQFGVQVYVVLKVVEGAVGSDALVSYGNPVTLPLSLKAGATAAEIQAAVEASRIVEVAKAVWGNAYVEGQYVATATELPGTLTENIEYTITYVPATYTVTFDYDEPAELPYGYRMRLPEHSDAENFAYDYTVNGVGYVQGSIVTVTGDTNITRVADKAYIQTSLYTIIANNYGNAATLAILSSGALKGDEVVNYRVPEYDATAVNPLLTLVDNKLTAQAEYDASYKGLKWTPYTYGSKGHENKFNGNVADWTSEQAAVQYILNLDVTAEEAAEILDLAATVQAEAKDQIKGMNGLQDYLDVLSSLTFIKLSAMQGVANSFNYVEDEAKNLELRSYFNGKIGAILAKDHMQGDNLKIYHQINNYANDGLAYYYANSEAIRNEVKTLSGLLTDLVADEEKQAALAKLLCHPEIGMDQYVDQIADLGDYMTAIAELLKPTNEAIDLSSNTNLAKLFAALNSGEVVNGTAGVPYILSDTMYVNDDSHVMLYADIYVDGVSYRVATPAYDRFDTLTADKIQALQAKINEKIVELLGDNRAYYTITDGSRDLTVGDEMTADIAVAVVCTVKEYTVKIDGVENQTVTINNLMINLPKHRNEPNDVYVYSIEGQDVTASTYTFVADQLDRLFVNGEYVIARTTYDKGQDMLTNALIVLNNNTAGNTFEVINDTLIANVVPSGAGLEAFAKGLIESGYGYIGLNGEPFMYGTDNGLEISLQTLVNAILNDNEFSNETLIALGQNNGGKLVTTNLQLGNSDGTMYEERMGFVLNLTNVPSQMVTIADGLEAIKNNVSFKSQDGIMAVSLNLPEKVYEVYLTALLAAGEIDTSDMNAVDNQIAFMFLYDYIDLILGNDDITSTTFQNTLEMFGQEDLVDLEAYEDFYQLVRKIYKNTTITSEGDLPVEMKVETTAAGINEVLDALGIDLSGYDMYLGMIRELNEKNEGIVLTTTATATLKNTSKYFEALVIDVDAGIEGGKDVVNSYRNDKLVDEGISLVKGQGLANSIDYTSNLPERLSTVTGAAAIYLLDDVDGDVVINGTTIIDLNGFTINGNIISNGKLFIVDSTMDTDDCGGVNGNVTGNVVVVAGNYTDDVTAYLKDGYKQVNGAVQNALYTIQVEGEKITLELNSDVMYDDSVNGYLPSIRYLAADIALDLAMHFYIPASLKVDNNGIYDIADYFADIVGLLDSNTTLGDIADLSLKCIDAEGISATANMIIKDLLDFGAIADAIENETEIGDYTISANPWSVEIKHMAASDYMTIGIATVDGVEKNLNVNMKFVGNNIKKLLALVRELDRIVVDEETYLNVDLQQPTRDGKFVNLAGSTDAHLSIDLTVDEEGDYETILAVVFAYGNPDKAKSLVAAMGDDDALKAVIDEMTVEEVLTALKVMSRDVSFNEMAAAVGADVTDEAAELESLYHLIACAAGKALEKLEQTETFENLESKVLNSKLGSLDQDGDGAYILQYSYSRNGDVDYRGYGVNYNVEEVHAFLKVKVFDFCLWGDANHDGLVNAKDATLVLQYSVDALAEGQFFCTKRTDVNGDGEINAKDATLINQHAVGTITEFPAEK